MVSGNTTLRNNRHLKHQVKRNIKFADEEASAETSAEEEENDTGEGLVTKQDKSENRFEPIRASARLVEAALRQSLVRA